VTNSPFDAPISSNNKKTDASPFKESVSNKTNLPAKSTAKIDKPLSKATKNLNLNSNSPIKYIQRQFSPIIDKASPIKFKENPIDSANGNATTPSKTVYLGLLKTTPNTKSSNQNNSDNSLDYSYEFRELLNNNTNNNNNKSKPNSTAGISLTSPYKFQQQKQLDFHRTSKTTAANNTEIPSPMKRTNQRTGSPTQTSKANDSSFINRQPAPKKFKQLTVSQAFQAANAPTQLNPTFSTKTKPSTSNNNNNNNTNKNEKKKSPPKALVSIISDIKNEPDNDDPYNFPKTSKSVNDSKMKNTKETINNSRKNIQMSSQTEIDEEFFADFDK